MAGSGPALFESDLSLLYPGDYLDLRPDGVTGSALSPYTWEQLEMDLLIDMQSCDAGDFFTDVPEVILYRQEVFRDAVRHPELTRALKKMIPLLCDIEDLRRMGSDSSHSAESYLYSITEIELYISVVTLLRDALAPLKDKLESRAFRELADRITALTDSDYYKDLNKKLGELTSRVREVKSVTIGVNLDGQLKASAAGLLSVNNEPFKSGELLEKILRLDFRSDEMTCIAPLTPFDKNQSENRRLAMSNALYSALTDVFRSSVKSWKKIVSEYVLENTDFLLRMMPEIELVTGGAELIAKLEKNGLHLTYPELTDALGGRDFEAKGLTNPVIKLKLDTPAVPNDLSFDEDGMIYVLTGPNRGGKSVITCAAGIVFAMAGLGLPVCADKCRMSPCDGIFTHFPTGSDDTIDKGRLGEECARLEKILDQVTDRSLVLLDESFSSTGAYEASVIASEVLAGLSVIGCRTVFSTHLHDLASSVGDINEKCEKLGGARVDTLVAEVGSDGSRSFRIKRERPDGKSYARDIAAKYGLSFGEILEKKGKEGTVEQ